MKIIRRIEFGSPGDAIQRRQETVLIDDSKERAEAEIKRLERLAVMTGTPLIVMNIREK